MAGKGVEMDVVEAADAYFKKFEIKSLLTQILIKLGEEQPEDPARAIRAHLEVTELGAGTAGAVVQPVPDADEEHDADESLFQACYFLRCLTGLKYVYGRAYLNSRSFLSIAHVKCVG